MFPSSHAAHGTQAARAVSPAPFAVARQAAPAVTLTALVAALSLASTTANAQPSPNPKTDPKADSEPAATPGDDVGQPDPDAPGAAPTGPVAKPGDTDLPDFPTPPTPPPGASGDSGGDPAVATEPDTGQMPVNLRLRRLEQRVQALKERAWRAKARVGMLKEAVLGGGVGSSASIVHKQKMGSSFRLVQLVYALDGTQIFARKDESGALHKTKEFEVLTGPIAPGSHTISVLIVYRGHGYGVFKYLNKYRFTVRSSHTFTASEGKATRIEVVGFERGGVTTPLEKRPAVDFKVTHARGAGGN